ncbi:hypothetical protein [Actinomadura rubrisoli]|uniref:Uncharacterized protein n=1 Tax=Actinomadura rubrisoli TaxID=2530368 RepID=A0A4R5CEZ8_9ACTN|nr:hypothetical protein [Actinomadura rubrisoli]TDD97569.1 hypothetical protein E1298_00635 [Actinomadura rubrisoli]
MTPMTDKMLAEIRERGYGRGDVQVLLDEVDRLRTASARYIGRIEELAAESRSARGAVEVLTGQRDDFKDQRDRLRAELAEVATWKTRGGMRELTVLRRDMGAVQAERDAAHDDAGIARDESERLRDQLAEAQRVAATLRASRTEVRTKLNEALKAADDDRNRLAEHEHLVRMLHPKIAQPRHGCCIPPSTCGGHRPECGGDHGGQWVAWPCSTIRALDDPVIARNRIRHLHKEFRGQDAVESTCLADREPWPCPTICALDGTEAGQ